MAKAKILVVDDDVSLRAMFAEMLEAEGYEVTTATNGLDALQQLGDQPIEAALVDMMMPIMDGLELCRELRATTETSNLPVILMSAGSNVVSKAHEVQATAALVKPFDMDGLLELIDQVLARHGNDGNSRPPSHSPFSVNAPTHKGGLASDQRFTQRLDD